MVEFVCSNLMTVMFFDLAHIVGVLVCQQHKQESIIWMITLWMGLLEKCIMMDAQNSSKQH